MKKNKRSNQRVSEEKKRRIIEELTSAGICPKLPHQRKLSELEALYREIKEGPNA